MSGLTFPYQSTFPLLWLPLHTRRWSLGVKRLPVLSILSVYSETKSHWFCQNLIEYIIMGLRKMVRKGGSANTTSN